MKVEKKELKTVQQIDGTGIKSPHEGELRTIAESIKEFMPEVEKAQLESIVRQAGGSLDDLGFGEDFTISFEYFPGVRIHAVYFGPASGDDEISSEADVKFFFSGEKVMLVSSEDLASFADLTFDYLRDLSQNSTVPPNEPSDLLQRSTLQRLEPFSLIKRDDLPKLAAFLDAKLTATQLEWQLTKSFFPSIEIVLKYDGKRINFSFSGKNLVRINTHARDQLAIFLLNHCLRFIGTTYTALKMPDIVDKAFSFSFLRSRK
nr:hypothetical protein [Candidatus Sigynarchaeota archaeon]